MITRAPRDEQRVRKPIAGFAHAASSQALEITAKELLVGHVGWGAAASDFQYKG